DNRSTNTPAERRLRAATLKEAAEAWLLLELARWAQHHLTADQRRPRPAADLPALVRREAGDPEVLRLVDGPLRPPVPDREVGVAAHADRAFARVESEDPRGVLGHDARDPRRRQSTPGDTFAPHQWHERLERWRAERDRSALRIYEDVLASRLLGRRHARRVIARDRGNVAVFDAAPERVAVRATGGAQRRGQTSEPASPRPLPLPPPQAHR